MIDILKNTYFFTNHSYDGVDFTSLYLIMK